MNASTSYETYSFFRGRTAHGAFRAVVAVIAVTCGILPKTAVVAQEYTVGDLPENPPLIEGDQGALVELPNGGVFDGGYSEFRLPSYVADDPTAPPPLNGSFQPPIIDDSAATECEVSDGWDPTGLAEPATRCQQWTAQVDALFLWQGNIPSRSLYVDSVTGADVLNANQAAPSVSVAPRYALMYHRDECRALEINYFQIESFAGQAAVPFGANPYEMNDLAGFTFNDIDTAEVQTRAQLKSWEFNLRRSYGKSIRWLAGFRWVEWNQQMLITDEFTDAVGPGIEGLGVSTGNNLYGGQLGGDMMLWNRGGRIKVNGLAKAGVFYNHQAYQTTAVLSERPLENIITATGDTPAFVGEVGLNGTVALTNWLSWRGGYTLFWLGGIASPANQLAVTDLAGDPATAKINTNSTVLLHGATTGLEARW